MNSCDFHRGNLFRRFFTFRRILAGLAMCSGLGLSVGVARADDPNYDVSDPAVALTLLDRVEKESFLAVRTDTTGRLFVGGREALFVYEPQANGRYGKRQELLRFPEHTWVYDIAVRGDDLYLSTVAAVYRVKGGRTRRAGLRAERLVWGMPLGHVHQCLHGLAFGPAGDLHLSLGDPLWYYGDFNRPDHWGHWTWYSQPPGTETPYNGVGGVLRFRPDGTELSVFSRGLRNSCGLCFDANWNLFTNDNDHESMPAAYVPGRLVHTTPHAYHNWPRGWLLDKNAERADMLDTIHPKLGRFVPVGQAYYDETTFPQWQDSLLVARWGLRTISRFPLTSSGATFRSDREDIVLQGKDQARPVGVCVGRGGRLFVTVAYMPHNDGSPTYRSDLLMLSPANDDPTHPFAGYDAVAASETQLWEELASKDLQRRLEAHTELLRRLDEGKRFNPPAQGLLPQHRVWLEVALALKAGEKVDPFVIAGTRLEQGKLTNAMLPFQVLERFPQLPFALPIAIAALTQSEDEALRRAAVVALFGRKDIPWEAVLAGPAISRDTYVRQAATLLMAEQGTLPQLEQWAQHEQPAVRLAGTLAIGFRLTLPPATHRLARELKLDELRAGEGYVIDYADAKVDLRRLGPVGNFTTADHWKMSNRTKEQETLFGLLQKRLHDSDNLVRFQAAHFLSVLNDPRTEPQVQQVITENEDRRLAVAATLLVGKVWQIGPFPDAAGFASVHPPEQGAVDLSAKYKTGPSEVEWQQVTTPRRYALGSTPQSSHYAYFRIESAVKQRAELQVGSDDGVKVWHNGKEIFVLDHVRGALPFQDALKLDLEPGSNDFLVRVRNVSGESALYLHFRALQPVAIVLPDRVGLGDLAERLRAANAGGATTQIPEAFLKVDWSKALAEGDRARGKQLFSAEGLGCAKCHGFEPTAAAGPGPSLSGARQRFNVPYLVESVLAPSKQISPVFRSTTIVTEAGKQYVGLVIGETSERIELLLPDAKRVTIPKPEIAERALQDLSIMPQGLVRTPEELRDLLVYMLSEPTGP